MIRKLTMRIRSLEVVVVCETANELDDIYDESIYAIGVLQEICRVFGHDHR